MIPGNAYKIVSNNIEDTMVVLCHDTLDSTNNTVYTPSSAVTATNASTLNIYKYFWDANKKVQSAWSTWSLNNCQILSAEAYDSYLYVLVNENTNTKLLKIDLRNPDFSALSHNIHLDFRTATLSGTYSSSTDLTTFTLPYSLNQTLKAVDATNGSNLTIDSSSSGTTQKIKGNHTSAIFGSTYLSEYKFSTPYVREDGGSGTISVTSGRYQIRQVSVDYQNSGFFQAVVTQEGRNNVTYEFNGTVINSASAIIGQPNITSGTYNIPIQSRNTHYTCTLKSDSHLPVHFVSAELEGFYHRRSQRA